MNFEPIPLGDEKPKKSKATAEELIKKYRIKHTDEIPKPDVVLIVNGCIVATRKNIFGISGKAKVGKSFLMALINSIVLNKGDAGVLSSYLPKGKDKILYFDTEQSDYHVLMAMQRIKQLVEEHKIDNLYMFAFDALNTEDRRESVITLMKEIEGVGLVIIDGIADLIYDPNDPKESVSIVDEIRGLASNMDFAVGYVLHQNPSDSSKMRGHLGTILTNKSETVMQLTSAKDDDSTKIVEFLQTRNKKPDSFSFQIIDGLPVIDEQTYQAPTTGRKRSPVLNDVERYGVLIQAFEDFKKHEGAGYSVIIERIQRVFAAQYAEIGISKAKEFFSYAKEMKWLVKDTPTGNWLLYPFEINNDIF